MILKKVRLNDLPQIQRISAMSQTKRSAYRERLFIVKKTDRFIRLQ
jgi:hypothetical protein